MAKDKKIKKEAAPLISAKEATKLADLPKGDLTADQKKALKRYQGAERAKKYEEQADTVQVMNVTTQGKITVTTTVEPIRGVG